MYESLSYSRFLRVIGQELDALGVDSFELVKWGDDYVVWLDRADPEKKRSGKNRFLSKFVQNILGRHDLQEAAPNRLYLTSSSILWADVQRAENRKTDSPTDRRDLSFVLRVIGDYLDGKRAKQFTISRTKDSTTVAYDQKREIFTAENLYDLGIHMYLRRSNHAGLK